MLDGVSLGQLRIFIAAVEEGSFAAASHKLRRAQSVISQTVSNFEQQIGVALFDRSGRYPKLTAQFIEKWQADHAGGSVVVRDLMKTPLPFVDMPWIGGAFTPAEQHSAEMQAAIKISDDLIAELQAADHIVIGTPMYNFSITAALKVYIDHIVRVGVTFTTDCKGLVTGKKATCILVSGGNYAPGSSDESYNVAGSYLRQILGFIGITDVTVVLAGQSTAIDQGQKTLEEFAGEYAGDLAAAAA